MKINAALAVGTALLASLLAIAALAPLLAPYAPAQQNLAQDLAPSSRDHLLGTDKLGRDVLSRIVYGSRISLAVGATTVAVSLAIGLWVGALGRVFGGRTRRVAVW